MNSNPSNDDWQIYHKVWNEIIYTSIFSSHILQAVYFFLSILGIKLTHVSNTAISTVCQLFIQKFIQNDIIKSNPNPALLSFCAGNLPARYRKNITKTSLKEQPKTPTSAIWRGRPMTAAIALMGSLQHSKFLFIWSWSLLLRTFQSSAVYRLVWVWELVLIWECLIS